jgi:hypothetical protein
MDAIQVIEMPLTEEQTTEIDSLFERQTPQKIETTVSIPQDILEKWAGYSQEVVSDSELLQYAGIEGTNIPDWFKKNLAKWIIDGTVTQQEFVNALTYLNENGILT